MAVQRANAIDATITLTDQITVIGFIASIAITLALVFAMIRSTNASLTRMKRGVERFGSETSHIALTSNVIQEKSVT